MAAVRHRVEPQHRRVLRGGQHRVGVQPPEHLAAALAERAGVVGDVVVGQHGQRGVQVVVAGVDELQADDRQPEQLLHLGARARVGAEAGAREHPVADDEEVALALVDPRRRRDRLQGGRGEPAQVGRTLGGPLGEGEARPEGATGDDEPAVGREHHVRQAGLGLDEVHLVPEVEVGLAQHLPLRHGQRAVHDDGRVHPGVDGVRDGEVLRPAHEVATGTGDLRHSGLRQRLGTAVAGAASGVPATVRSAACASHRCPLRG